MTRAKAKGLARPCLAFACVGVWNHEPRTCMQHTDRSAMHNCQLSSRLRYVNSLPLPRMVVQDKVHQSIREQGPEEGGLWKGT
jgi:hypothetical protein